MATHSSPRTWAWMVQWKAPCLKGRMEPLWLLVPLGKIHSPTWGEIRAASEGGQGAPQRGGSARTAP